MDDELLGALYHYLFSQDNWRSTAFHVYSDALMVLIELFRVGRQLSQRQALNRKHWPLWTRRLKFPSYSQFRRRVAAAPVQQILEQLGTHFRQQLPCTQEKVCDGKPLLVGGYSKDPDAHTGKAPGGWAKGYKLHAIVDAAGAVETWAVTALHVGEGGMARQLVGRTPLKQVLLRADANYDSVELYRSVAEAGGRLLAPRRKPGTGLGHQCQQHEHRLQAIAELEGSAAALKVFERHRIRIEQVFGHLHNAPFGIWGLPSHVRRLPRVERWIRAKLALYHLYLVLQQLHRQPSAEAA
ncbi:MAG TPA: transposase [Chloroflexota bacterium]|nr:transposase [Chloroflexota bacterium]